MKALLSSLTNRQKISIVAAVVALTAGLYGLVRWNHNKDFRPLFSGVAAEDAGAIVAKLKETGIEYRVEEGGSAIMVPSMKVAETRLQMAALGLPKSGRIGYELFDKTNFGVTDFAEQVNYHRALEGELERSITSIAEVESARIHITFPKNSLFAEARQPAKASVMVKLRANSKLAPQNILAITNLVASAVEGLTPEGVALVDMHGNMLSRPKKETEDGVEATEAALDYRQRVERDLLAKINANLEPVLGANKYRSGVSVECDFTSGEQSEETFDPNKSVMVTSQKTEDSTGGGSVGGIPGSASNLPRPTSRPGAVGSGTQRKTENINYQTSRLVRRVRLPQGSIKRLSISVLVDHTIRWEGKGAKAKRVLDAPSPEKLKIIKDLVAGVTGFQADRGDQLIVESLPFDSTLNNTENPDAPPAPVAPQAAPGIQQLLQQLMQLPKPVLYGMGGGLALVALLMGGLYMRRAKQKKKQLAAQTLVEQASKALEGPDAEGKALADFEGAKKNFEDKLVEQSALKEQQEAMALAALRLPTVTTQKAEVLTKHLTAEAKKDPQAMAHIIKVWLNER